MDKTRLCIRRCLAWLGIGLMSLAMAGCATEAQVKKIVADSNATLLASRLPDLQLGAPGEDSTERDPAAQIEEFIAEHPDQRALNGALRVRQAIVFLSREQYNQAEAAFKEAAKLGISTDRDKALVAVYPELIWWYENSSVPLVDPVKAGAVRKALIQKARDVQRSPDTRDLLAEGSAWVGFKEVVAITTSVTDQKLALEQTLNGYAFILDPADLEWLCKPPATKETLSSAVRRRVRAQAVLRKGADLAAQIQDGNAGPTFDNSVVQELVWPPANTPRRCAPLPKAPA